MKSKRSCRIDRRSRLHSEKFHAGRSLIEKLDSRVYMCTDHVAAKPLGDLPWLTSAVTYAANLDGTGVSGDGAITGDPLPRVSTTPAPIRINAGGTNYTDPSGAVWAGDKFFSGGTGDNTWVFPVANTTADSLYTARRYGVFNYNIPVAANGTYSLRLHFVDPKYSTAGNRVFAVKAEGGTILSNFDIAAQAGARAALVKSFNVTVNDGTLNLNFVKIKESPIVSGIEVLASTVSPPPPQSSSFTKINYVTKASSPIARAEALKATWNNRLYVFGGFSGASGPVTRSDYYNPATNAWVRIADLPQRLTHVGMAQDANNAYFIGGYVGTGAGYRQTFGSNKVWKYNFASNSYSALPNLPQALSAGGAAIIGRNLHYFSGQNASRGDINIHLVLNLDNPGAGWKNAAPIPHARSHLGAVVTGGKIYTVGGQVGNDGGLTTLKWVDVYDPATNSWSTKSAMPRSVSHISSATFVMGGRILVMGGESAHNAQLRDVFAYNPTTNVWAALSPLPAAKFSGVADHINGKIIFTTGGSGTTTWVGSPA